MEAKKILIIATYGIDVYYGLARPLEKEGCVVIHANNPMSAMGYLRHFSFDVILVNIEPDGDGHAEGIEYLETIYQSARHQHSICFGVSVASCTKILTTTNAEMKLLSLLAGWLTLPLEQQKTVRTILKIANASDKLTIGSRISNLRESEKNCQPTHPQQVMAKSSRKLAG